MNYGNPLVSKEKKKVSFEEAPLEKFKPIKPRLSRAAAKALVEVSCSPAELLWLERWLKNLVQNRSLPPQICGVDALDALTQFLAPHDVLCILETVRNDFRLAHPQRVVPPDDFGFLLEVMDGTGR